jgi:hypothetical protein
VLSTPTEAHYWHLGPYNFFLEEKTSIKLIPERNLNIPEKT